MNHVAEAQFGTEKVSHQEIEADIHLPASCAETIAEYAKLRAEARMLEQDTAFQAAIGEAIAQQQSSPESIRVAQLNVAMNRVNNHLWAKYGLGADKCADDVDRKSGECRFEVNFSNGDKLEGMCSVSTTGQVKLSSEDEATIDAHWNKPVTDAAVFYAGRKFMLESASDGWRLGNDLGSEAPGMLQQMTLQDAIHRLNEALTLEQILALANEVDAGFVADVRTVEFSDTDWRRWTDAVRIKAQSIEVSVQKAKTRTVVLATAAYAVIETPQRSMDVRLEPGRSAAKSLRESVAELREKASRINRDADFIEAAIPCFELARS